MYASENKPKMKSFVVLQLFTQPPENVWYYRDNGPYMAVFRPSRCVIMGMALCSHYGRPVRTLEPGYASWHVRAINDVSNRVDANLHIRRLTK